jgi:predicted nucleic acid-binding protein
VIVVDASLALEMFIVAPGAAKLQSLIADAGAEMAAPEVFDLEVLQALRRMMRLGWIDQPRAAFAVAVFQTAPITRFSHSAMTTRIWALRENLTAYDAAYFALAEMLDAPLWTRDTKFASIPGHRAKVVVI